jgi:hypothetical protein
MTRGADFNRVILVYSGYERWRIALDFKNHGDRKKCIPVRTKRTSIEEHADT